MRFIRAEHKNETFYAILKDDRVIRIKGAPYFSVEEDGREYSLNDVRLLAPVEPSKIVCVGKNYKAHADEMGDGHPEEPLLFMKPSTSVIGPEDDIVYPPESKRLDYEAELAVVIGKKAHRVESGHAAEYIFGYTCLNDVTARDIQKGDGQWTRGKGFDTFCPIGPWIETELDAGNTGVRSILNGEIKQNSNTCMMTHSIDKLICYMSACMTLLPGDVIATGTPEGISPMREGDVIEIQVDGIGTLRNKIIKNR